MPRFGRTTRVAKDSVFSGATWEGEPFRFNKAVAEVFPDMLRRSIPGYEASLEAIGSLAARYESGLPEAAVRFHMTPGAQHARHLFVVRVPDRERLRDRLDERGIGTAIHYPVPVHRMTAYGFLGLAPGSLPVTERLAGEILTLPLYPELSDGEVDRVCAALGEALA